MRFIFTLAFVLAFASVSLAKNLREAEILSLDFIDSINRLKPNWVAGRNFPENTTKEYLYKLNGFLGVHPDPNYKPKVKVHSFKAQDVPQTFDARTKWTNCESLYRIRDQGACGSCWAFAAVESMSDRLCIHSNGASKFTFSPEDLLSCCVDCGDCVGGWMMPAFDYYINQGLVSGGDAYSNEGCSPYAVEAHDNGQTPACVQSCSSSYPTNYNADKHYGSSDYVIDYAIDQIQYEIMTNGPIIVNFEVFEDFYNYRSGVYHHVTGNSVGFHVVKVIGWGEENGMPYWLIANSWGTGFGDDQGFFKMLRGQNECGIENNPYAVLPRL